MRIEDILASLQRYSSLQQGKCLMVADSYQVKFLRQTEVLPRIRSSKSPNQSCSPGGGEEWYRRVRKVLPLQLEVREKPSSSSIGPTTFDLMAGMFQIFQLMMHSKLDPENREKEEKVKSG